MAPLRQGLALFGRVFFSFEVLPFLSVCVFFSFFFFSEAPSSVFFFSFQKPPAVSVPALALKVERVAVSKPIHTREWWPVGASTDTRAALTLVL